MKVDEAKEDLRIGIQEQASSSKPVSGGKLNAPVSPKDDGHKQKMDMLSLSGQVFRPAFNAPVLPVQVRLNFGSKDSDGSFSSPEQVLKHLVSESATSNDVVAASGVPSAMHAVSGMAGVGKTTALIGISHDADLRKHFSDGILYMSLGAEASEETIVSELDYIMQATGATTRAEKVKSTSSLVEAVSIATIWFSVRRILFLVDDIRAFPGRPERYLPDLKGVLRECPESRMAISTRNVTIAANLGSHVDFGARELRGRVSIAIFSSHAVPSANRDCPGPIIRFNNGQCQNVLGILDLCSGLPIALALTGKAVASRVASGLNFEYACRTYLEELSEEINLGASVLEAAIDFSLRAVAEKIETVPTYSILFKKCTGVFVC